MYEVCWTFKNIFNFTTARDWDCVAAVERLPALHYSEDFIFLSFGIIGFIVSLCKTFYPLLNTGPTQDDR